MTILKRSSPRGSVPFFRTSAITFALIAAMLLAGCGVLSASNAVVSQGLGDATLEMPDKAENALLVNLHGTVEVNTGDGQWTAAETGHTIGSGQQVRAGALSNVTLVFYDGSQTYLGADAQIAIDMLDARTSGPRLVQLTQVNGESRHIVMKSDDSRSRFAVLTSMGDASAADSIFGLRVLPGEFTQFWVESGTVAVVSRDVSVDVIAGQTTIVLEGQPPQEAMFRTTGEGRIMQSNAMENGSSLRRISARIVQQGNKDKLTLCHATGSATNPYVEITVSVNGATNGHSNHAGDIIPVPPGGCPTSTGSTSSTSRSWNIAGQAFRAGKHTMVIGNPQPGDWVTFESHLQSDGTRIMDRIVVSDYHAVYQFSFIGRLDSAEDTFWTISGRTVAVNELTVIEAGITAGETVQVMGGVGENGAFWAGRISRTDPDGSNFRFAGNLASMGNDTWVISGIDVAVDTNTTLYGDFEVGNPVIAAGVIEKNGTWLATSIELISPEEYRFEFTGKVQSLSPWTVSGISFDTGEFTEIDSDINVSDAVRVAGIVSTDGLWTADRIEKLDTDHAASFAFQGPVVGINPWNVRQVPLATDEDTAIVGDIRLGDMVKATGWIMEDGTWLATAIRRIDWRTDQGCFLVTSVVDRIEDDRITLRDGQILIRSADLDGSGDLREGSVVRYHHCVDEHGVGRIVGITMVSQQEGPSPAPGNGGKVVICHIPPGNPGNAHTIEIGAPAVSAHLAHGDTLGPCPGN